jgi:hypothetical protein
MVVSKLLCRCENSTLLKENERHEIADVQCWWAIAGYTLYDHKTKKKNHSELQVQGGQNLLRTNDTCIPKPCV